MACPTEMPYSKPRSQRLGSIRRLSFAERVRLAEYRHARTLERIEDGAGRFVIGDRKFQIVGQRNRAGWTVTDGTVILTAADADEAETTAWDWLRLGGPPVVRLVQRPQEVTTEPATSEAQTKPWIRSEPTKTGRTCRQIRKAKNRPIQLYDRPRST